MNTTTKLDQDIVDSVEKMTVNGNRLELPAEQISNYAQVKKRLTQAGGKYSKNGFTFPDDAATIKARLVGGEDINDKKKYQFFETPEALARQLVDMCGVTKDCNALEPSAGRGAIASILEEQSCTVTTVELMPANAAYLGRGCGRYEGDFLSMSSSEIGMFDRIVANPPFTKNQDIDHVKHMYSLLKDGGKMVSMTSKSWTFGSQKKQVAFREWLDEVGGVTTEVPEGTFKESGTNIATVIIEISK